MKFLSLAFGVFILLLSVYPCCQDACKEERTGEALATSWEAEDLDLEVPCSPFFPCGACGGFTFERGAKTALTSRSDFVRTEIAFFASGPDQGFQFAPIKPPAAVWNPLT